MIAKDRTHDGCAPDRGSLSASLRSIGRALHRVAGLLDPWPGYAVPSDELVVMLAAERQETGQPIASRMGLDELLDRHRRLLAEPMRSALCGEWLA
jgi:hypothetical protein